MKRHFMTLGAAVAALVFLLTLGAPQASADTATFTITNSNLGSGFNGPFGTVTITLVNSTTADVTFQAQDSGVSGSAAGYQFIDGSAADLNVNGSFSVGSFGVSQLATFHTNDPTAWTTSSGQVDGFGVFNLQINTQNGSGSASDQITFVLTATNGNFWTSAANVLSPNGNGNEVAAHIATCSGTPCNISNTGAFTGFGSQTPSVPDGGMTLMLLGGALVGLETVRRKFHV
jgi:hypothetical protein